MRECVSARVYARVGVGVGVHARAPAHVRVTLLYFHKTLVSI